MKKLLMISLLIFLTSCGAIYFNKGYKISVPVSTTQVDTYYCDDYATEDNTLRLFSCWVGDFHSDRDFNINPKPDNVIITEIQDVWRKK